MKLMIKVFAVTFLCTFLASCQDNVKLVEFKPLVFDNHGQYVIQKTIPNDFYKNLQKVLDEYGVSYVDSNGVVFVKCKDYQNKELVSNYTAKALDTIWLQNR